MTIDAPAARGRRANRWLILAIVYSAQLAFAVMMQSVPPVLNLVINDLGISHAEAGLLMGIFALPGVFMSIPIGSLSDRYGVKYLTQLSLLLMVLGTAFSALSSSFLPVLAGRLAAGLGAITLLVVLPQFLSQWFLGRELSIAMGVYNTGVPVAGILSFNIIPLFTGALSWHAAFWLGTATSLIALVLFLIFYSPPPTPSRHRAPGSPAPAADGLARNVMALGWPLWLVAMSWMWFNAGFATFVTFLPDFFVRQEAFTPEQAGRVTSYVMWGPLILSTLVGTLVQKLPRQRLFVCLGNLAAGAAVLLILVAPPDRLIPLMFVAGLGPVLIPSSIFSLPALLVDERRLGLAFGVLSTTVNVAILGGPLVIGWVRDFTGSYLAGFLTVDIFLLFSILSILAVKKPVTPP
ncbi:MAG: MFS transporter [Chloroflexi bacterium]|nr:MFS transporter [Chloroflexota bacterium]